MQPENLNPQNPPLVRLAIAIGRCLEEVAILNARLDARRVAGEEGGGDAS